MKSSQGSHIVGLDHLRALAALLVLYWHTIRYWVPTSYVPRYWVGSLFEEGWLGVTLFITITGFVFTILTGDKRIDYFPFLKNRFLRIFPLLFLIMLYSVAAKRLPDQSLFAFFNLLGGGVVFGTWTLVIEWQFYLSYPFIRDSITSKRLILTAAQCVLFCALFVIIRTLFSFQYKGVQYISYWTIFGQADAFIFGILAGHIYLRCRVIRHIGRYAAAAGAIVIVVGLWAFHEFNLAGGFYNQSSYPSNATIWIVWPTISALIFAAFTCCYCLVTQFLTGKIARGLAYLGTISYSTYMLHFIIIEPVQQVWNKYINLALSPDEFTTGTLVVLGFQYPIILAVSALSYHFIERPFLQHRVPYLSPS